MFDDAPFGVARLDGDSVSQACVIDANSALVELTEGAAVPGGRLADLFAVEDGGDDISKQLLAAVDGAVPLMLKGAGGNSVNVYILLDSVGRPSIAYLVDTTEQSQLKNRLVHSEKMQAVGTLAGGVAHDFNNMLTAVMGYTDNLLARHPVGDPSFDDLQQISELSQRSAELVKMLLAFSRQQTLKREMLNVSNVLNELNYLILTLIHI